jgi:hypothetical protein
MRRLASTTIALLALLLATLAAAPGVSAQAPAEHPAVGVWLTDGSPDDSTNPLDLTTIAPGGIATIALPDGTGYGPWAATGERSADATFLISQRDPEAGFVGYATIRTSIEVAEDGQSFAGTYTIEFPAAMAEAMGLTVGQQVGPGTVTGQRIAVEPMGEAVPFPEEGGPEPVESPPTPEASPAG